MPRGLFLALALGSTLALGFATYQRHRVYGDEIFFWEDVTRKTPTNGRAFYHLGYA